MSASAVRVLIVDDESSIRCSLVNYLEDRGCTVVSAESAEEAIEMLETEPVDVAIVDIRLPGMDGNGLILAAHEMLPSLKFIVYTGSVAYRLPPALAEIGAGTDYVFQKPLPDLKVLLEAVNRLATEGAALA